VKVSTYSVQILPAGSDHRFAVVEWVCQEGSQPRKGTVRFADDYDAAAALVPDGLEWHDRDPRDPPSIVETWEPPKQEQEAPDVSRTP
jgi:hypothetical protein